MATQGVAQQKAVPARAIFYVVRHAASASLDSIITVLRAVPSGAHVLAAFENPNGAIDFAESAVCELRAAGVAIELVDPPYGLVGAG